MLTLIYPYRNRNIERIRKSLDSLKLQNNSNFEVHFVDYGSQLEIAREVELLISKYDFANYTYYPTHLQPWNKCKALNSVIKNLNGGYCFVADVDMIYHPEFVTRTISLQKDKNSTYFKVGFLNETESKKSKDFGDYDIDFVSTHEATGLSMFPVEALQALNGFDEFYHFWGAEDTDMHVRLRNNNNTINFYEDEVLILHQWHPSYRSKETSKVTNDLQLSGIVQLNHQHLKYTISNNITKVNSKGWGNPMTEVAFETLQNYHGDPIQLSNNVDEIKHLLYCELSNFSDDIDQPRCYMIKVDDFQQSIKYKAKKGLGKKVPNYYTLKEINDMLLLHLISYCRNYPYIYEIIEANTCIKLSILKSSES